MNKLVKKVNINFTTELVIYLELKPEWNFYDQSALAAFRFKCL